MTDLLVKLYDLPDPRPQIQFLEQRGIYIHRAMAFEKKFVVGWVAQQFGEGWSAECEITFSRNPISCMIAVTKGQLMGFACHDSSCRNFFGPIGIDPLYREKGVGRTLLLVTLEAMAHGGFAYAIIGHAGPTNFFKKCVGAISIPGSTPGIYRPSHKRIHYRNDTDDR